MLLASPSPHPTWQSPACCSKRASPITRANYAEVLLAWRDINREWLARLKKVETALAALNQ